jgi:hypothetical protein
MFIHSIYNHIWRNISTIYITRLASKEIFSPSNKIHREVCRDKNLSAPRLRGQTYNITKRNSLKLYFYVQRIYTRKLPVCLSYFPPTIALQCNLCCDVIPNKTFSLILASLTVGNLFFLYKNHRCILIHCLDEIFF